MSGYISFAAPPVASTGVPLNNSFGVTNQPVVTAGSQQQGVVDPQTINSPNARTPTGYTNTPNSDVIGGGNMITDLFDNAKSASENIVSITQARMKGIEQEMKDELAANGGQMDPAKLQIYSQKMTSYELVMQLVAKLNESYENSARAFLR